MIIRHSPDLRYSDVTPKQVYLNRRRFLAASGVAGLALPFAARAAKLSTTKSSNLAGNEKVTSKEIVSGYNNYYEFGTGKQDPAENAPKWKVPSPWTVQIGGEVMKPKTFDLDAIMKLAPVEERIYRHRCVEAWSIVVPWIGFSLNNLLKQVEPTAKAKFVQFDTYYDPKIMLSPREAGIPFPYKEGLRLDEAMHNLTLLGMGMYGETLPNQNGAPLRLVIPWKYGFKSIKSVNKITFVETQPKTDWAAYAPGEYGFYSNVNPKRDHPRWTQAKERRLGEGFLGRGIEKDTVMFNGYGDQVAGMYTGMDLMKNY
ncbi:MAG: protein-methionine-sulfoxide reductase catalytic subunit MsrP [Bryobacterales bacterium]|nr:protein-methionine-sulfoxide reductase catalytic subunit MsrP [Bryobacterales bacterium]